MPLKMKTDGSDPDVDLAASKGAPGARDRIDGPFKTHMPRPEVGCS